MNIQSNYFLFMSFKLKNMFRFTIRYHSYLYLNLFYMITIIIFTLLYAYFLDTGLLEILFLCDVQINQLPLNNKITIFIHVDHVLSLHEAKGNDKGLNTNRTVGGFHIPMVPITQPNKRIDVCNLGASLPRRNHQEGSNDISIDEKVDVVVGGFD